MRYLLICLLFFFSQCSNNMNKENPVIHPIRLKPGEDLFAGIENYVRDHDIKAGWIATCAGSLTQCRIRYANQPNGDTLVGHFEIVSLSGTVSTGGSHLHISVSDSTGRTIGGHLLEGNLVYTTAEIVIGESRSHQFLREQDGSTPWKELQIRRKD